MAQINPTSIRPVEAARLLNSTELGFVLPQARIYRDFNRVGFRIAAADNSRNINLVKYIAWLFDRKHAEPAETSSRSYDERRDAERQRQAEQSLAGRDIGALPDVVNIQRKGDCERNFQLFCESYFPETFALSWSPDHLKVIEKIEKAVLSGGLFAMAMPRGSGKALALDTPLATPAGWTTMEQVKVGDWLFDEQGIQCKVVAKSPVYTDHKCFKVTFNDGEEIVCDAGHLWQVEDIFCRKNPYVRTTEWLASRYAIGKRGYHESRFRIPMQKPLQTQSTELPIEPYALGVWLGDGTCSCAGVTLHEDDAPEIAHLIRNSIGIENLEFCDWECKGKAVAGILTKARHRNRNKSATFQWRLRKLNLLNNKHIPASYLRADVSDRLSLLQGIMDTDGHADSQGHCEICIKYPQFAEDFGELLSSLGIKWGVGEKYVMLDGKEHGPYQRFHFNGYQHQEIFRLSRKQSRMKSRPSRKYSERSGCFSHTPCEIRTIRKIEEIPSVPVQCVEVDSPSHLYLAGRKMVPTHNSSLSETAALWAMLYGHREFVTLIGSTESAALEILDSIKTELEVNELLAEDFPEVCFPIAALEGIANRCAGQLHNGERTRITWTSNEIVLPSIKDSKAGGVIVRVAGITGRIRGMKYKRSDGRSVRPSLVIIDDPQTSESAGSLEQTRKRIRVLAGDILGLAGPGQKISGVMPCTIIRPGDMADTILDKNKHPDWNGEKTRMLYKFPANMKLWDKYAEIRAESLRTDGNFDAATDFYRENREAMDAGAEVSWEDRFNHDEISALQHAMNLKFQDEAAFQSEYQNDPLPDDNSDETMLTVDEIASKVNGLAKDKIPIDCDKLTMFIDVQKALLFYVVTAWSDDFTGAVIDYGAWPDQKRRHFSLTDANPTIQSRFPQAGLEGGLYAAMQELTEEYFSREWQREDGAMLKIGRAMIDANWGQSTDIVYQFCRQSSYSGIILPSHGRFVGASSKPMTEYKKKPGDRLGLNWMIPNVAGKRAIRHVIYDTNFWKSFVHARLAVAIGDKSCLSLYGRTPLHHQLIAEHLTAEYRVKTAGRGRTVDEWKIRPQRNDNHWLDCLAGCAVCGSMLGATLPEHIGGALKLRKAPMKLSARRQSKTEQQNQNTPGRTRLSDIRRNR